MYVFFSEKEQQFSGIFFQSSPPPLPWIGAAFLFLQGNRYTYKNCTFDQCRANMVVVSRNATEFEYLEEFPVGVLQDLEWRTGRKVQNGLFVIMMEYGKNFSGPDKDVFYYNRAVGEAQHAWQSNFLHPVIYYYKRLPTGKYSDSFLLFPFSPVIAFHNDGMVRNVRTLELVRQSLKDVIHNVGKEGLWPL